MSYAVNQVMDNWELSAILAGSMAVIYAVGWCILQMAGKSMKQETVDLLTEDFTSSIEDRVKEGEITREDATEAYRRLKQLFPTRNLYPSVEWLKGRIKRRITEEVHHPVKLPGGEAEVVILDAFKKRPKA